MTAPLPPYATEALLALLRPLALREPDFRLGDEPQPYLRRWHLTPRGTGPAVYLHEFLRSDDDRALHDHPYDSVSIVLAGGYLEHLPGQPPAHRPPGSVITRTATALHRVELLREPDSGAEQPCWSLFLTGPRIREWGFACPNGWQPWQAFQAKGCAA